MTPTSTSYTIPASLTGYSSNQTIDPSELNLWRVIKKNNDGTIEVVSEYVSSTQVYFKGQTGFLNCIGSLNAIAAQYTNEKYVQSTRHMGYNNQLLTCSSVSSCPADTGYQTDTNLVQEALGTLIGKTLSDTTTDYWLASRDVYTTGGITYYYCWYEKGEGVLGAHYLLLNSGTQYPWNASVRPILVLKADIQVIAGDGSSENSALILI